MRSSFLSWIRGFVQVGIRGENTERLVNRLLQKGMEIWDIHRAEEGRLRLNIHISDFFRIRPLLKETGCRLHVEKRSGFPFLLDKLEKRKSFAAGFLLFLAGLFLLSNLVWQVEVEGLETLKEEEILEAAESVGIYSGQWLFRLPEPDTMSEQLMQKVPGVSWIGVKTEGTKVRIRVVESTSPEERPLVNPRHLVAATDAVISNIYAEKGKPGRPAEHKSEERRRAHIRHCGR